MVDFRKRLSKTQIVKKTNPVELYDSLDRRSIAGPLRPAQEKILTDWYDNRKGDKDLIIKLHTGEGKTLIGLLILQSRINAKQGPCLFVCPNKYLVQQAVSDAKKFGINYCSIGSDNSLPNEFIDGKKILITHVQKVFNGKTIFGLGNDFAQVHSIILDDSHACIDSIKGTFTINLDNKHQGYKEIFELFKDALPEQGEGTFLEIENGDYNSFLPIPYWNWIDKSEEVLKIISQFRDETKVTFAWPFIKDNIRNCQAFISGQNLEISPIHIPIEKFSTFHRANQRILMSATTQDDSFFIKGLGFNVDAVKKPLTDPSQVWSGEKMLLIPSLIHESLDRSKMVSWLAKPLAKDYGIVSLVSSFPKAEAYRLQGSVVPTTNEVGNVVDKLKKGDYFHTIVFANRYDGIDLPDETCRILVVDGRPFFHSLSDRYEESNRIGSDLINIKIAQKVEQGLGRSVRGEKDYCIIFVIGADLVSFIRSSRTKKYFSAQTQKQIDIGLEIAEMAVEELTDENALGKTLNSLMKQSLERDEGWKEFYKEEMDKITFQKTDSAIYEKLLLERKAAVFNYTGDYQKASSVIQQIVDKHCEEDSEKGWYLQLMARYMYLLSKMESNALQKSAFLKNHELLKPKEGITYEKLDFINQNRVESIKAYIDQFKDFQELRLSIEGVLADLEFGTAAEKFEGAFQELGRMLGFLSERPDKEIKNGPDNLWCGVSNQYFLFECKSEVNIKRSEIHKHEAGQMNLHCAWFESQYGGAASVHRVLVIPIKDLSYQGFFTHPVEIMRKGKLRSLRGNVKAFFREFSKYEIDSLTDEKIQEFLNLHKLDIDSLKSEYTEAYYKKKS